jgi:hypothetical protein
LWGIAPPEQPDHSWQHLSAFKRKFGGVEITLVPTLDYVLDAAAYEHFRGTERASVKCRSLDEAVAGLAATA